MSVWDSYPSTYRSRETAFLKEAVEGGNCAWVVGLSGSGKSNLAGFFVNRFPTGPQKLLIDCNRLGQADVDGLYRLLQRSLIKTEVPGDPFHGLEIALDEGLKSSPGGLCLVFDRFENLPDEQMDSIGANLRALRDAHKYELTYIVTSRLKPRPANEMDELFSGHTLWLGPLNDEDARWSIGMFAARNRLDWDAKTQTSLLDFSGGYASLLRAACEAAAHGCALTPEALAADPAVRRRVDEFLASSPAIDDLVHSNLQGHPLLDPVETQTSNDLTAGEARLLAYLQTHPDIICEKDDLIKAVWPEDKVYVIGIRDDSLAQLVRRLRVKIEEDPSNPRFIQTIPGRGYRYKNKA